MSFSPQLLVQRARVGSAALRHQDVRQLEGEPVLAIALALSPPRLWGYLLDTTLDGFADGYMRPHDGKVSTRIHQGLRVAQNALRGRIDGMIDHRGADVALLALACEERVVHLLVAGPLRAYAFRQRSLRRLSTHDSTLEEGVLKVEPVWCAEPIEPGDLVLAGPSALFPEAALDRVREACLADRQLDPAKIPSLLGAEPAPRGTAVVAFRFA